MATTQIAPATTKAIKGTVFSVETVTLAQREGDEKAREMGVVFILEENTGEPMRFTDFSGMHKVLVADQPIRAVYDETVETGDNPRIHRNLANVLQPQG